MEAQKNELKENKAKAEELRVQELRAREPEEADQLDWEEFDEFTSDWDEGEVEEVVRRRDGLLESLIAKAWARLDVRLK